MSVGLRLTSRILLFDRDGNVLLFLTRAPDTSGVARWLTPGGGVDAGENHEQAAIRELFEETGLRVESLGAPVWSSDFDVEWDAADHSRGHAEFYRLVVDRFEPSKENWMDYEKVDVERIRWWTPDELDDTDELCEPRSLPAVVRRLSPPVRGRNPRRIMTAGLPTFTLEELEQLTGLDTASFDTDDAVDLGLLAVAVIRESDFNLAVQIVIGEVVAFRANLKNTGAGNDQWLAGKAAVARHFNEPSLLVKRRQEDAGTTLEDQGLDFETYRALGGSMPIRVAGAVIGTITMSGEPDVVDHGAVVETINRYLSR